MKPINEEDVAKLIANIKADLEDEWDNDELFTDEFMQAFTKYKSLDEMAKSFIRNWLSEDYYYHYESEGFFSVFGDHSDDINLEDFISVNTYFDNLDAMYEAAQEYYIGKQVMNAVMRRITGIKFKPDEIKWVLPSPLITWHDDAEEQDEEDDSYDEDVYTFQSELDLEKDEKTS